MALRGGAWGSVVACMIVAGCGGPAESVDGGGDFDTGHATGPDAAEPLDGAAPDGAAPDSGTADGGAGVDAFGPCGDCDDHVDCTADTCVGTTCRHTAAHGRCTDGEYCDAASGCQAGLPCAIVGDCARPDTCVNVTCDVATATCSYAVIDHDFDGDPPVVCGGTDCDDSTPAISGITPEACNGIDEDCDSRIDEDNETTTACGDRAVCTDGGCRCGAEHAYCLVYDPADPFGYHRACVDNTNDPRACGACGVACPEGVACVAGRCACPASTPDVCEPFCVSLADDEANCGACGVLCPTGVSCVHGTCDCGAGMRACSGVCVDLATDESNCGACFNGCPVGVTCTDGHCPCPGGVTYCLWDGACTNLDDQHCGACDDVCGGTCNPTTHECTCEPGLTACRYDDPVGGGSQVTCSDLASSPWACGACDHPCPDNQGCVAGRCSGCVAPYTDCGGGGAPICVDLMNDEQNCGACGYACGGRIGVCSSGRCY